MRPMSRRPGLAPEARPARPSASEVRRRVRRPAAAGSAVPRLRQLLRLMSHPTGEPGERQGSTTGRSPPPSKEAVVGQDACSARWGSRRGNSDVASAIDWHCSRRQWRSQQTPFAALMGGGESQGTEVRGPICLREGWTAMKDAGRSLHGKARPRARSSRLYRSARRGAHRGLRDWYEPGGGSIRGGSVRPQYRVLARR